MRGCNRYLALALAILFVFTTVPILFIFNLGQVTTNREAVKEALTGQALLDEAFAILVREGVRSQPAIQNDFQAVRHHDQAHPGYWKGNTV